MSAQTMALLRRHPRYDAMLFALLAYLREHELTHVQVDDIVHKLAKVLAHAPPLVASLDTVIGVLTADDENGERWRATLYIEALIDRKDELCRAKGTRLVVEQRLYDALKNGETLPFDAVHEVTLPEYDVIQQQLRDEQAGGAGS